MEFGDYGGGFRFRHYGCISERQISNMNVVYGGDPSLIPGYDQLDLEDQHMVRKAFEVGAGTSLSSTELNRRSPPLQSPRRISRSSRLLA
jgi:hypothetical protein